MFILPGPATSPNGIDVPGADTDYGFSIPLDFPAGQVAPDRLALEIQTSTISSAPFLYISTAGNECDIIFGGTLNAADQATLVALIGAHSGNPLIVEESAIIQGTTNAPGTAVTLSIPLPPASSGTFRVIATARVLVAGGIAVLGDTFSFEDIVSFKNIGGPFPAPVPLVSGTAFEYADASQKSDTVTFSGDPNNLFVVATQVGVTNTGTLLWTLKAEALGA